MNKSNLNKLLREIFNICKDSVSIVYSLLALYKLSKEHKLPHNLQFNIEVAENKTLWIKLLKSLTQSEDDNIVKAFSDGVLQELEMPIIYEFIKLINNYEAILNEKDFLYELLFFTQNQKIYSAPLIVSTDKTVIEFTQKILGSNINSSIYMSHYSTLGNVIHAVQTNKQVSFEGMYNNDIYHLLVLLADNSFQFKTSNNIQNPSFIEENRLMTFDYGICIPPFNMKFSKNQISSIDKYQRFIIKPTNAESANILHYLKQVKNRFVIAVTNSFLSSRADEELRRYLTESGLLKAVISMPTETITYSSMSMSFLVIEPNGNNKQVKFVDVEKTPYVKKTTKRQISLTDVDALLELINSNEDSEYVQHVDIDKIIKNNVNLDVVRYVFDLEYINLNKKLKHRETIKLKSLVSFERGLPFKLDAGDFTVLEVGAGDIGEFGNINTPQKQVSLTEIDFNKHSEGLLQANDIVIMLKGSSGKTGIVSENIHNLTKYSWSVNQSAIILRVKNPDIYDPRALYIFLNSDYGQAKLAQITTGATIKNIQLSKLKELDVLLPTKEEQQQAIDIVENDRKTQTEINQLLEQQKQFKQSLWCY